MDVGRRLPFVLASMHQGQQGDMKAFSLSLTDLRTVTMNQVL